MDLNVRLFMTGFHSSETKKNFASSLLVTLKRKGPMVKSIGGTDPQLVFTRLGKYYLPMTPNIPAGNASSIFKLPSDSLLDSD